MDLERLILHSALDLPVLTATGEDEHAASVGILRGYVIDIWGPPRVAKTRVPRSMNLEYWTQAQ